MLTLDYSRAACVSTCVSGCCLPNCLFVCLYNSVCLVLCMALCLYVFFWRGGGGVYSVRPFGYVSIFECECLNSLTIISCKHILSFLFTAYRTRSLYLSLCLSLSLSLSLFLSLTLFHIPFPLCILLPSFAISLIIRVFFFFRDRKACRASKHPERQKIKKLRSKLKKIERRLRKERRLRRIHKRRESRTKSWNKKRNLVT